MIDQPEVDLEDPRKDHRFYEVVAILQSQNTNPKRL